MDLNVLFIIALLVEALVAAVVMALDGGWNKKNVAAFLIGGFFFWLFGVDLVAWLGLEYAVSISETFASVISAVVGAVLIFRFSGNFNDLFDWLNGLRQP